MQAQRSWFITLTPMLAMLSPIMDGQCYRFSSFESFGGITTWRHSVEGRHYVSAVGVLSYSGGDYDLAQVVLDAMAITDLGPCSCSDGRPSVPRFRCFSRLELLGRARGRQSSAGVHEVSLSLGFATIAARVRLWHSLTALRPGNCWDGPEAGRGVS